MAVPRPKEPPKFLGYGRVSTDEQVQEGRSLESQSERIADYAKFKKAWLIDHEQDEGASARSMKRPGLQAALLRMALGEADYLVVCYLDRLSRNLSDTLDMFKLADKEGWGVIILDLGDNIVDTKSATGKMMISLLGMVAQWQSDITSEKTLIGLAKARANGKTLGNPRRVPEITVKMIQKQYRQGKTITEIADILNQCKVPTATNKPQWRSGTVRNVLMRTIGDRYVPNRKIPRTA
jgi:DNA invertase Pin-like site-specific DNA recombinase